MKKAVSILFFLFFTFCFLFSVAQELPNSTKQQLENLADATEQETEDDTYLQQLFYLRRDPMNLNAVTADELQLFFFLTDLQIQSFIRYRNTLGNLISIYELQSVPGWDLPTIYKLLPFVTVEKKMVLKEVDCRSFTSFP